MERIFIYSTNGFIISENQTQSHNVFSVCVYCFRCAIILLIWLFLGFLLTASFERHGLIFTHQFYYFWSFVILNFVISVDSCGLHQIRRRPLVIVIRSYGLEISVKFGYYVSAKTVLEAMKLKREAKIASGRGLYSETI